MKKISFLMSIPLSLFFFYSLILTRSLEKDKQSSVFASSATVSRNQAMQLKAEIELFAEQVRSIAQGFYIKDQYFVRLSKELFQNNEKIHSLYLFQGKDFISSLKKEGYKNETFLLSAELNAQIQKELISKKTFVHFYENKESLPALLIAFNILISEQRFFALAEIDFPFDLSLLNGEGDFESVFYFSENKIITSQNQVQLMDARFEKNKNLESVIQPSDQRGILELDSKENEKYIGAYSELGLGPTKVITFIKKSKALDLIPVLWIKSIVFFIALAAFGVIVSLFSSARFAKNLRISFK